MKKKLIYTILAVALLAGFLYAQNKWISLTKYEIVSDRLPGNFDGFKILQLSDLHSTYFGKDQKWLTGIIANAEPDIIVFTGDLIDGRHYDEEASLSMIRNAVEIAPLYYVTGNHEFWSRRFGGLENKIREAGAVVLRDSSRKLTIGNQSIYLTGIDDPQSTGNLYNVFIYIEEKLKDMIPVLPEDGFKILLHHRPEVFSDYVRFGVDIAFTGHAHGGQFRLPFIGGLYSPGQGFFPKYTAGVHRDGNTAMVVNRGLGNSVIPQRLFNRPEVVLVTLRSAEMVKDNTVKNDGSAGNHEEAGNAQTDVPVKQAAALQTTDREVTGQSGRQETSEQGAVQQPLRIEKQYLINENGNTVAERILIPDGFQRIPVDTGSFGEYLRKLPVKAHGSNVMYFNGDAKPVEVHEAVLDIDVGNRDLQQCADSIIRLRAEYLYSKSLFDQIHFNFTNGFNAEYSKWRKGYRIKVSGNDAHWVQQGVTSEDYSSFRKYLDVVFAYAGTLSLSKEMKSIPVEEMQPGDVFMYGNTPGHCVIVLDMAENKVTGEKLFILAQGYMPAQEIHILKNPANEAGNPWYTIDFGEKLSTPEWTFTRDQLMRFEY